MERPMSFRVCVYACGHVHFFEKEQDQVVRVHDVCPRCLRDSLLPDTS